MKKRMLFVGGLFICGILFFNACETTDLTAPVIKLNGSGSYIIELGDAMPDLSATAEDNKDGNITTSIVVTGTPENTDRVGLYTITYNVTDKAGNADTKTRTLTIKSTKLASLVGTAQYSVAETDKKVNYNVTVSQSQVEGNYNVLNVENFGAAGVTNSIAIKATSTGIVIDPQTITVSGDQVTITGTGTYGKVGSNYNILVITYTATIPPAAPYQYIATYTRM